jgi:hypothetical protein
MAKKKRKEKKIGVSVDEIFIDNKETWEKRNTILPLRMIITSDALSAFESLFTRRTFPSLHTSQTNNRDPDRTFLPLPGMVRRLIRGTTRIESWRAGGRVPRAEIQKDFACCSLLLMV